MVRNQELVESRPVILSLGKCIANIAKWHVVELLKVALMPLRACNYYLIKAEVLYELFRELDKKSFERSS
jgi:hypothetical protein